MTPAPSANTAQLKALMAKYRLNADDVAELLDRKPHTVREWRCANANDIPNSLLELLTMKLAARPLPQGAEVSA